MGILARLVLPADFGLLAAGGSILWLLNIFAGAGVGPALVQRVELKPEHVSTSLSVSLLFGLALGGATFLSAPLIAALFQIPPLGPVLRVMSLILPVTALSIVSESLLQRELRFRTIAIAELVSYAVGYGIVGVALAWRGAGVWALVAAELVKAVGKAAMLWRASPHSNRLGFERQAFGQLVRFGSGYAASSLSMYIALEGDNLIIARTLGSSALGMYGRAYELMFIPAKALGDILEKVMFPALSRVQDDAQSLATAYRRGLALTALLVLPFSAGMIVLAPEVVLVLLGQRWTGVIAPLRILATAMYFQMGYAVGKTVANASGAVMQIAWRTGEVGS